MLPSCAIGHVLLLISEVVITSSSRSSALLSKKKNRNHGGWQVDSCLFLWEIVLNPKCIEAF